MGRGGATRLPAIGLRQGGTSGMATRDSHGMQGGSERWRGIAPDPALASTQCPRVRPPFSAVWACTGQPELKESLFWDFSLEPRSALCFCWSVEGLLQGRALYSVPLRQCLPILGLRGTLRTALRGPCRGHRQLSRSLHLSSCSPYHLLVICLINSVYHAIVICLIHGVNHGLFLILGQAFTF